MLYHPTLDKLQRLRLAGMHQGLIEQAEMPEIDTLGFAERLGLLVDREITVSSGLTTIARTAAADSIRVTPHWVWKVPRSLQGSPA